MRIKKRKSKFVKIILIIIAVLLVTVICVNLIIYFTTRDRIFSSEELFFGDADCILVLGAGIRDNGSPSNMLEDRLKIGIELYNNNFCNTLLMSGDHGRKDYDEVNSMKNYAVSAGVPKEHIFMDHAGFSTYESLYRASEVFGAKKVIIVSQEYHLYRALYIADSLGLDAVGVEADLRTYVGQSMRETREIAARFKDFFYTIIKPSPTYLGEPISLDGPSEVTNG